MIAAFVVFTGTQSRGDLLSRGWGRVLGTIGGVAAGMGLAALVGGDQVLSLVLLFVCVFLALYLVRVSPSLLAFWITAVLALVYGLIGQFSVAVLVLRIEETASGRRAAVLAAFVVLPKGTRAAFGDAVESLVDTMDDVLVATVDRIVGRAARRRPPRGARGMDEALQTLRQRARTLAGPTPRRRARSSYQRGLRVLVVSDHYLRSSWCASPTPCATRPGPPTLDAAAGAGARQPRRAARRPRARAARAPTAGRCSRARPSGWSTPRRPTPPATADDPHRRTAMLGVARLLRRIDQAVVGLALDLGAAVDTEDEGATCGRRGQSPSTADNAGAANTRSGS